MNDAILSWSSYEMLSLKIPDVLTYLEVKRFIFSGLKAYRHGLPRPTEGNEIVFYADDVRDALSRDTYGLSDKAMAAINKLRNDSEYYSVDRIILVIPKEQANDSN